MALQSTSTAQGWIRDLQDKLSIRFANVGVSVNSVRAQLDGQGWPMLFFSENGNESEGQPVIAIRIRGLENLGTVDIFGNATVPFAPHQAEIAFEVNSAGAPYPAFADLLNCAYEVSRLGVQVLDKQIAHGTAVTEASMDAANPVITIDSIDWPLKGA